MRYVSHIKKYKFMWNNPNNDITEKLKKIIKMTRKKG